MVDICIFPLDDVRVWGLSVLIFLYEDVTIANAVVMILGVSATELVFIPSVFTVLLIS